MRRGAEAGAGEGTGAQQARGKVTGPPVLFCSGVGAREDNAPCLPRTPRTPRSCGQDKFSGRLCAPPRLAERNEAGTWACWGGSREAARSPRGDPAPASPRARRPPPRHAAAPRPRPGAPTSPRDSVLHRQSPSRPPPPPPGARPAAGTAGSGATAARARRAAPRSRSAVARGTAGARGPGPWWSASAPGPRGAASALRARGGTWKRPPPSSPRPRRLRPAPAAPRPAPLPPRRGEREPRDPRDPRPPAPRRCARPPRPPRFQRASLGSAGGTWRHRGFGSRRVTPAVHWDRSAAWALVWKCALCGVRPRPVQVVLGCSRPRGSRCSSAGRFLTLPDRVLAAAAAAARCWAALRPWQLPGLKGPQPSPITWNCTLARCWMLKHLPSREPGGPGPPKWTPDPSSYPT